MGLKKIVLNIILSFVNIFVSLIPIKKNQIAFISLEDNVLSGETKRMSLGVKRKIAIVAAFMSDPDVLILDEPTSGLDPVMQETFIELPSLKMVISFPNL